MNSAESILKAEDGGEIINLLNEYILACRSDTSPQSCDGGKKKESEKTVFPNLAGFCRFLGIGTSELKSLIQNYPDVYGRILTVLEDEALNSKLSPTLVSAYLKTRLGYDASRPQETSSQLEIKFEHDIFEDGG